MVLKKYKEMVRPFDMMLIVMIMLASFIPMGIFAWQQANIPEDAEIYAVILIDGNEVGRFRLYEDAALLYTYTSEHGLIGNQYNLVEIEGTRIRVQRDNSPDQVGVNMGFISRPGQTIVVLPHRFLIRIEAVSTHEEDIIIPF